MRVGRFASSKKTFQQEVGYRKKIFEFKFCLGHVGSMKPNYKPERMKNGWNYHS